jgi:hypothetical protein
MFYFNNNKLVPYNLYDILTSVALAHLILGSGIKLQGRGLLLCTDSFNLPDVVLIMNVLIIKYRLLCTLQLNKDKYIVYIYRSSMVILRTLLKPYIITKMLYKVDL